MLCQQDWDLFKPSGLRTRHSLFRLSSYPSNKDLGICWSISLGAKEFHFCKNTGITPNVTEKSVLRIQNTTNFRRPGILTRYWPLRRILSLEDRSIMLGWELYSGSVVEPVYTREPEWIRRMYLWAPCKWDCRHVWDTSLHVEELGVFTVIAHNETGIWYSLSIPPKQLENKEF
jgi:hypothetical protein